MKLCTNIIGRIYLLIATKLICIVAMKPSITISVTHMPAVKSELLLPTITLYVKPHPKLLIPEFIIYIYIASEHQPYKYIPLL